METNIKAMTVEQLKSLAYDCLVAIEQNQNNLKIINQEIVLRNTESPTETKKK